MGLFSRKKKITHNAPDQSDNPASQVPPLTNLTHGHSPSLIPASGFNNFQQRSPHMYQYPQQQNDITKRSSWQDECNIREQSISGQNAYYNDGRKLCSEPYSRPPNGGEEEVTQYRVPPFSNDTYRHHNTTYRGSLTEDRNYQDGINTARYSDYSEVDGVHLHVKQNGCITIQADKKKKGYNDECNNTCCCDKTCTQEACIPACECCTGRAKGRQQIDVHEETYACYDPNCIGGETTKKWGYHVNDRTKCNPQTIFNNTNFCQDHKCANNQCHCCRNNLSQGQVVNSCNPCISATTTTTTYHTPVNNLQTVMGGANIPQTVTFANTMNRPVLLPPGDPQTVTFANTMSRPVLLPPGDPQSFEIIGTTPVCQPTVPYLISNRPLPFTVGGVPVVVPTGNGFQSNMIGPIGARKQLRKLNA